MSAIERKYQDADAYVGMIGACLEATITTLDDACRDLDKQELMEVVDRAQWILRAAIVANDQLAHATGLR